MDGSDLKRREKIRRFRFFVWYLLTLPFFELRDVFSSFGGLVDSLSRPEFWVVVWMVLFMVYNVLFVFSLLFFSLFVVSLVFILGWYIYRRGDWVFEGRRRGKLI